MPDLYSLHVGPVNAAYYQRQFQRFESAGKAVPSWNHGAAFFTLAWLLLRKLWRPAAMYGVVLLAALALWWLGLHGRVPLAMEATVCAVVALLLCVLPGFMGNGLYYHHVRKLTLQTLTSASSLGQARVQLAEHAVTKERLQMVASIQALVALGIAFGVFFESGAHNAEPAPQETAPVAASGPPDLVIPSVDSVQPMELQPFTPDVALPTPDALGETPSMPAPAPEPATAEMVPTSASMPAQAAAPTEAPVPKADELSMVALAQSIPAQTAANGVVAASTPTPSVQKAPVAAPVQVTAQETAKPAAVEAAAAPAPVAPAPAPKAAAAPKPTAAPAAKPKVPAAAKPAATASAGKSEGKYYLNAGVYAQVSNVDAAVKKLKAAKLNPIRQTVTGKNGELTRLRIGPFDTRKQAEQAAAQARKLKIDTTIADPPKR